MAGSSPPFSVPPDGAELARHVEFVQRLARRLAADGPTSDDLAQETWVATLEHRGPFGGALSAWLARVLRNRAALVRRVDERRGRREAAVARPEATPATAELVQRMELHGRVVAAVLALPDAYREVVLRRHFENEGTAEIGRALGLPEPTVRTRLARAHERLRQSLAAEFGGDRALCALTLARLARSSAPPVPAPALAPVSPLALTLAMKKISIAAALVVLALLAVWSVTRASARARNEPRPALAAAPAAAAPLVAPEIPKEETPLAAPAQRAEIPVAGPAPVQETAAVAPPATEPEPREAWFEFHVQDRHGNPVPDAEVRILCYRTREDPGSSTSLGVLMPVATSDRDGVARLEYPVRLEAWDGPERPRIGALCCEVRHSGFVTLVDWDVSIDENPATIVLQRGAMLIVAGFIGERRELLTDVTAHPTDEIKVAKADWIPAKDGRPSCSRLPTGKHALYLTRAGAGGTWASEVAEFTLAEDEVKEITLELLPPRSLLGVLDARVPRPVVNGEVQLNLYIGRPEDRSSPKTMRTFGARVESDGSFLIEGLPPGRGEMIGMCDGWVSQAFEDERVSPEESSPFSHQQVDPAALAEDEPFVLAMERTARLEVLALDPEGRPVENAVIHMWPNVHWSIGYSQIFLEREWNAATDATGRAAIENVPPGEEGLALVHASFCLPVQTNRWGREDRQAQAVLVPGETTELVLQLEACRDE
jgi:RNA polymerase sigma-70 factor (ECF subfamily)